MTTRRGFVKRSVAAAALSSDSIPLLPPQRLRARVSAPPSAPVDYYDKLGVYQDHQRGGDLYVSDSVGHAQAGPGCHHGREPTHVRLAELQAAAGAYIAKRSNARRRW